MSNDPEAIIRHNRMKFGTFSWQGQAPQYDQLGSPGEIVYRRFTDDWVGSTVGPGTVIDTLLHYDEQGYLEGILNYYPHGAVERDGRVLDAPGGVNITLRPDAGPSVSRTLLAEARRRWNVVGETPLMFCAGANPASSTTVGRLLEDGNRRIARPSALK